MDIAMVPTTFEIVGVHTQFVWFGPVGASEKRFLCRFGIAPRPYDRSFLSVFRRAAKPNPNPKAPISKPVWKCPKQGGGVYGFRPLLSVTPRVSQTVILAGLIRSRCPLAPSCQYLAPVVSRELTRTSLLASCF